MCFYKMVTFYSEIGTENYYRGHAYSLKNKAYSMGIDLYIEGLQGYNDYYKNCRMKPSFILHCMEKFKTNILWIDADSIIRSQPVIPNEDVIGAVKRDTQYKKTTLPIYAGALYFPLSSKEVVKGWARGCANPPSETSGDHSILCNYLESNNILYQLIQPFADFR